MSRGLAVGLISRCDSCGMLRLKFSGYNSAGSDSSTSRSSPLTVGDHPMSLPLAAKLAPDCSNTRPSLPAKRSVTLDGSPGVAPAPRSTSDARSDAACAELTLRLATREPSGAICQSSLDRFTVGCATAREKPICNGCPCLTCAMRRSRTRPISALVGAVSCTTRVGRTPPRKLADCNVAAPSLAACGAVVTGAASISVGGAAAAVPETAENNARYIAFLRFMGSPSRQGSSGCSGGCNKRAPSLAPNEPSETSKLNMC